MRHYSPEQLQADATPIEISSRWVTRALVPMGAALVLLGWFREAFIGTFGPQTTLGDLRHIALIDSQFSIAGWFESIVLILAAMMLALIGIKTKQENGSDWRRWTVLAILFAGMSVDKIANLDQAMTWVAERTGTIPALWLPLLPATAIAVYVSPVLRRMPHRLALGFLACGVVFVGGAIVMDAVSSTLSITYGSQSSRYVVTALVEESLELAGAVAFCGALVCYIRHRWKNCSFQFG